MKKTTSAITGLAVCLVISLHLASAGHCQSLSGKPQPGDSTGTIKVFSPPQKLNSSVLRSGKRLEARLRKTAETLNLRILKLRQHSVRLPETGSLGPEAFFEEVPYTITLEGDFHQVMAHLYRIGIYNMVQNPRFLELEAVTNTADAPSNRMVRLTTRVGYFRVASEHAYSAPPPKGARQAELYQQQTREKIQKECIARPANFKIAA